VTGGSAAPPVSVNTANCGTIPGGGSCTVIVSLQTQAAASFNTQATVESSAGSVSIGVSGTIAAPQAPALLTGDPASLDFGEVQVGQSRTLAWTIRNVGDIDTADRDLDSTGDLAFSAADTECAFIPAGGQCVMEITFEPTAAQRFDAQFSTESLAPEGGRIGLTVTGVGTEPPPPAVAAPPNLNLSPGSIDLGTVDVGNSVSAQITITNDGGPSGTLSVSAEEGTPNDVFSVAPTTCPSLNAGERCVVTVTYTPTGGQADDLGTVFVRDSNGNSLGTTFVTGANSGFIDIPSFF